jgi:DNA-binding transcriptional MerR regulator
MTTSDRLLTIEEAAAACGLDALLVHYYAELSLITPGSEGYNANELAELRRVRRLMDDLELEPEAIAIILRMRRRMLALQTELRRLEVELRNARRWRAADWIEGEWRDL